MSGKAIDQETKRMKSKGIGALLVVLIVILGGTGAIFVVGSMDQSAFNSTGASNIAGYGIAHEVTAVFGYNDTGKTWYTATLTKTDGSGATPDSVKAVFTFARNATDVGINVLMIQTGNSSQDVYNLLQQNALFEVSGLTSSTTITGVTEKISAAGLFFGQAVNATATSAFSDKGVTLSDYNFSLYSNTTNNLNNKTASLGAMNMFASLPTAEPQYIFWITPSTTAVSTNVVSPTITITFYQNFQRPFGLQAYTDVGLIVLAFGALAGFIAYLATPEHYNREEIRAGKWYNKQSGESTTRIYAAIGLDLVIFAFIGALGTITPFLGGWGGALAFLFGFGVVIWAYTSIPKKQKYSDALLLGTAGGVVVLLLNYYLPFGTVYYNMAISTNDIALIGAAVMVIVTLAITVLGIMDTGRYNLRERYTRRPIEPRKVRPSRR